MARPRRELSTEQKIENIINQLNINEQEIESAERHLAALRDQRVDLENNLRQEKINLLLETMESKNISLDAAKEIIDNVK